MKKIKNIPASIKQRLLNKAKSDKRSFTELLQYFAIERFLYRVSISKYSDYFILKGALMLRVWNSPEIRPTMDIDMLGNTSNKEEKIYNQIKDVLLIETPDGLQFDIDSLRTENITQNAEYKGVRVRFLAFLENSKINMQIDIGFGDSIFPAPEKKIITSYSGLS